MKARAAFHTVHDAYKMGRVLVGAFGVLVVSLFHQVFVEVVENTSVSHIRSDVWKHRICMYGVKSLPWHTDQKWTRHLWQRQLLHRKRGRINRL